MKKILSALNLQDFSSALKRIWPYIKKYKLRLTLGMLIAIPVASLDAVIAMFLQYYTDNVIVAKNTDASALVPLLIIGFAVIQGVTIYLSAYLLSWVGTKVSTDIKKDLYKKLVAMDPAYFDSMQSGTVVQRFSLDANLASTSLINNFKFFIVRVFSSVALVFVLFYNSWHLALLALIVLAAAVVPLQTVRKKMKNVVAKSVVVDSDTVTALNETFSGNKIVASYNLAEHETKKYFGIMDDFFSLSMKMVKYTNSLSPVMYLIIAVGIAGVLWFANMLIIKGIITSGNFVSFLAALIMLYTPIKIMGNNYVDIQKSFLAIDRIFDIFAIQPSIQDAPEVKEITSVREGIAFENVSFAYNKDKDVLRNINMHAKVGQTIALVGNSGGGKSTFVSLIPRFYDVKSGSVKIDGTDIRDISLHSLRDKIAVVFQDNFLFSGTIRDNIMLGKPGADKEELHKAVKHANLEEFISTLEKGLDTEIGERGCSLSGGQRQRVAIARALIKNAPVIVLDEATSALDNKSEAVVQKALDTLMKGRTVFVIAHRLSTIQNADKILVINDGVIAEEGTHNELMAKEDGAYKALYNAQFKTKEA